VEGITNTTLKRSVEPQCAKKVCNSVNADGQTAEGGAANRYEKAAEERMCVQRVSGR